MRHGTAPLPLFITCQNAICGAVVEVSSRDEQRTRKFCDVCERVILTQARRSAPNIPPEAQRRGVRVSLAVRQQHAMARFEGMTPLEIYQMGWRYGYNVGRNGRLAAKAAIRERRP